MCLIVKAKSTQASGNQMLFRLQNLYDEYTMICQTSSTDEQNLLAASVKRLLPPGKHAIWSDSRYQYRRRILK